MRITGQRLSAAFLVGGVLWIMTGWSEGPTPKRAEAGEAQPSKAKEGEEPAGESAFTPEEIMALRCEHDMPTYECAECRYEAGVVKVDPSLTQDNAPEGIIGLVQTTMQRLENAVQVTGEIQLDENRTVHVTPRISGMVRSLHVDLGSLVKAGDSLFEIDSVELGEAVAEFEKNIALAALAERNYQREKSLWEQKICAEADMLDAKGKLDEIQAAINAAEQRLHVFGLNEAEMASIKAEGHSSSSGALSIRAMQDGSVLSRDASVGEAVPADREILVLSDLSAVWAWLDVLEGDLEQVLQAGEKGDVPVEIRVKAFPNRVFKGKLDHVGSVMEEETRTVKARAIIENKDRSLRPGMFCEASLYLPSEGEALIAPKEAILSDEGVDFAFKPLKDDYYYRVNVVKGRETSSGVEIIEGLANNDTIVSRGAFLLKSDVLRSKMGAGCAD